MLHRTHQISMCGYGFKYTLQCLSTFNLVVCRSRPFHIYMHIHQIKITLTHVLNISITLNSLVASIHPIGNRTTFLRFFFSPPKNKKNKKILWQMEFSEQHILFHVLMWLLYPVALMFSSSNFQFIIWFAASFRLLWLSTNTLTQTHT